MALPHLNDFDEPFCLSVIEALAAGTPVIARPRGSMHELNRPAVTGYLVNNSDAAVEAARALGYLDRHDCRAEALERFSADRMVDEHERLFRGAVGLGASTST